MDKINVRKKIIDLKNIPKIKKYFLDNLILILILVVGIAVRIYKFGQIPNGLNQDEASAGYDAFSILYYGIDRNGFNHPVILEAWGSGMNALYSYLSMPFIYLFGLNVFSIRLVNLIFGILSLLVFYLLISKISGKKIAILSIFLLSISPWHIMLSRWGLESNLFPAIFLLGVYFFLKSLEYKKYFLWSFVFFGLSLYVYNTALFIAPLFIFFSLLYCIFYKKIEIKNIVFPCVVFLIISLPIFLFVLINFFKLDSIITSFFSIPRFSAAPRFQSFFIDNIVSFKNVLSNVKTSLNLLETQNDGLIWNNIPNYGCIYQISIFFALFGLIINSVIIFGNHVKSFPKVFFIWLWFVLSAIMGIMIDVNINRINIIFLPLIFLTASGIYYLFYFIKSNFLSEKSVRFLVCILVVVYLAYFGSFAKFYFTSYSNFIGPVFFESLGDAINYAQKIKKSGPICITDQINMPYIFVLFYTKTFPQDFLRTVKYTNPGAEFQRVASFGNYIFGTENCKNKNDSVYIINNSENVFFKNKYIKSFKYYSVVY